MHLSGNANILIVRLLQGCTMILLHYNQSKLSKNEDTKLLISKFRTEKSSDWSNANSLILFAHPLHAAYSRCLLPLPTASLLETSWEV